MLRRLETIARRDAQRALFGTACLGGLTLGIQLLRRGCGTALVAQAEHLDLEMLLTAVDLQLLAHAHRA